MNRSQSELSYHNTNGNFRLDSTSVAIDTKDVLGNTILEKFDYLPQSQDTPELKIELHPGLISPPDSGIRIGDRVWTDGQETFLDLKDNPRNPLSQAWKLGYQVKINGNPVHERTEVNIFYDSDLNDPNKVLSILWKSLNKDYFSRYQTLATNILYDILEPILHLKMIANGSGFIHAASVLYGDSAVLFPGWSAAGKTGTSAELIRRYGGEFISDDLSIISNNGYIQPYTKSICIKPGEFAMSERSFFSDRDFFDYLHWELIKRIRSNARRWVSPQEYYGYTDYPEEFVPITKVIYLIREERQEIKEVEAQPDELAARAGATIAEEFRLFLRFIRAMHSAIPTGWLSVENIVRRSIEVYESAFKKADSLLLSVPAKTPPQELGRYIHDNLV